MRTDSCVGKSYAMIGGELDVELSRTLREARIESSV